MIQSRTSALRAGLSRLCRVAERVAIALLVAMSTLIIAQLLARNILNHGLAAAEELARFSGLGLVFLAAPLLLARQAHVRVEMFEQMMPQRVRRLVGGVNELLAACFCGAFLYGGWLFMGRASRFATPVLGIPNIVYYAPALLGVALLLLVALGRAFDAFTGRMGQSAELKS